VKLAKYISARQIALTAVFAALSVIVSKVVPGIPIIGASGSKISFDASLAPVYGIVIGPYLGFMAALIGGLAAAGSLFTILTSFCTAVSAFVAGMLTRKRVYEQLSGGWAFSAIVLGALIAGWYATDVGRQAPYYPIPHITGLLIILLARDWIADKIRMEKREITKQVPIKEISLESICWGVLLIIFGFTCYFAYEDLFSIISNELSILNMLSFLAYSLLIVGVLSIIHGFFSWIRPGFITAVAMTCYCGVIADHMLGNLIFIGMLDIVAPGLRNLPEIFMAVLPVSIIERSLFTAIGTIFGVALLSALSKASIIKV